MNDLCSPCWNLFDGHWQCGEEEEERSFYIDCLRRDKEGREIALKHHNVLALELSAREGCPMCVLILREAEGSIGAENLSLLRESSYPDAHLSVDVQKRTRKEHLDTWDQNPFVRFLYNVGISGREFWCFMHVKRVRSPQSKLSQDNSQMLKQLITPRYNAQVVVEQYMVGRNPLHCPGLDAGL